MLRNILFVTTMITLFSCGSDSKPATEKASTPPVTKNLEAPLPYGGSWISEDYLKSLQNHKSPRKAQDGSEECFIHIPATTSGSTFMVYNFHEGGPELIAKKENENYNLWEKQNDSLIKVVYTIEPLSTDKIKLGKKVFVKINPVIKGQETLILEETLFKGQYENKKGEPVEFKNNGEVTGLGKYKYYNPVIDYFDAGYQIDQVGLGETKDQMENFGFKFRRDGLDLYHIKCLTYDKVDKRCVEVDFGDKAYSLRTIQPK